MTQKRVKVVISYNLDKEIGELVGIEKNKDNRSSDSNMVEVMLIYCFLSLIKARSQGGKITIVDLIKRVDPEYKGDLNSLINKYKSLTS